MSHPIIVGAVLIALSAIAIYEGIKKLFPSEAAKLKAAADADAQKAAAAVNTYVDKQT